MFINIIVIFVIGTVCGSIFIYALYICNKNNLLYAQIRVTPSREYIIVF